MRKKLLFLCLSATVFFCSAEAGRLPIITVLDFQTQEVSQGEMKVIISMITSSLFKSRFFTVIDVGQREVLLKEMEFSLSDCTDEKCQIEIGKQLAAEYIVVGHMGRIGSKVVLSAKVIKTGTAETVSVSDGIYASIDELVDDLDAIVTNLVAVWNSGGDGEKSRVPVEAAKPVVLSNSADEKALVPDAEIRKNSPSPDPGAVFSLTSSTNSANLGLTLGIAPPSTIGLEYNIAHSRLGFFYDYRIWNAAFLGTFASFYFGVGGSGGFSTGWAVSVFDLGLRIPAGIRLSFIPEFDLFLEVTPVLGIVPSFGFYLVSAIRIVLNL